MDHKSVVLVINDLGKLGRDGVVSCRVFHDKPLVTLHPLVDVRLFDGPFSNIRPLLIASVLLLGVGRLPASFPI